MNERVVIKFTADWCSVCKSMAPLDKKLSEEYGIPIEEINVDNSIGETLAKKSDVRSLPTYIYVEDEAYVRRHVGGMNKEQFKALITPTN